MILSCFIARLRKSDKGKLYLFLAIAICGGGSFFL